MSPPTLPSLSATWWTWPSRLRRWLVLQLQAARLARAIRRATLGGVLGLLLLASGTASAAPAPMEEPGVLDRVADAWPEIEAAAQLHDLDPVWLAGLLVVESRVTQVAASGADGAHWGPGQVRCGVWGRLLVEAGIVGPGDGREALADDRWTGIAAAAWVLRYLLDEYGPTSRWDRGGACVACLYNKGPKALSDRDGCNYSAAVDRAARGLRARLAGSSGVRVAVATTGGVR